MTAAFIGPGTVLTASKSGATEGYGLLWVVLLSVVAAIVFQEMAARLGIVTGRDLAQTLRQDSSRPFPRIAVTGLVLVAILVGNAAYQAGNLSGAAAGIAVLTGLPTNLATGLIALVAAAVLFSGRMALIQYLLVGLVAIMSVLFALCAILVQPDWSAVFRGLFSPRVDGDSLMLVLGLLGTTVVPYNLFLHSRTVIAHWHTENASVEQRRQALRESRADTVCAVSLGGLITMAILITAAATFFQQGIALGKVAQIADQLRPLLGTASPAIFSAGLAAAGLTSAITAPLAAGFVAAGCFGWSDRLADWRTRTVMLSVVGAGVLANLTLDGSPAEIILLAQVANGLILPVVAVFLLIAMNGKTLPSTFRNRWTGNLLGAFLIFVVLLLAVLQLRNSVEKFESFF